MIHRALTLLTIIVILGLVAAARQAGDAVTALTHATVVDPASGRILPDSTVIIDGRRITAVAASSRLQPPAGARVIDAAGKYLIPGLWDMHVHIYDERYLPLFTANGVTGVRQMWGYQRHHEWRTRIAKGELVAPQQVIASPIFDGPRPIWPGSIAVANAAQAREAVRTEVRNGADFIKVYALLSRDSFMAIMNEAHQLAVPVEGHVPDAVSLFDASHAGQRTVEHLSGVLLAASSREAEFRDRLLKAESSENPDAAGRAVLRQDAAAVLASFDARKASSLYDVLAKNHTTQVPTLVVNRAMAYLNDADFRRDDRLKYMPRAMRTQWDPTTDFRLRTRTDADWAQARATYGKMAGIVADMHRHGVQLLAGTDTTNPYTFPGFSLHDELALLVEAGLTPLDALRTATSEPAAFLGRSKTLGTIAPGRTADMVLLDGNPLEDIHNTSKIAAVVRDGHIFDRQALDQMLREAERVANLPSIAETLSTMIGERGVEAAVAEYRRLKREAPDRYEFGEDELNGLGYQLLGSKRVADAIEVFKLNVEMFPASGNPYDSLGEAYMIAGQKDLAIRNYQRSLELDRLNTNAVLQLRKLQ
jgi:imidazolonepropionase-like amidohydrolase